MSEILLAIAPIFLLIILGHLLRRGGIPSIEFWHLNDNLVYWVLFPSLLFYKMATVELSGDLLGDFATVIYLGFGSTVLFALTAGRVLNLGRPVLTSVLQGCVRHNTFIALAVAERVFGQEGLALAALITALLIPVTNVSVVTLMVMLLRGPTARDVQVSYSLALMIIHDFDLMRITNLELKADTPRRLSTSSESSIPAHRRVFGKIR